jgi:hypothetical protein
VDNFFADALSRNPIGLNSEEQYILKWPKEFLVVKLDLYKDQTLRKELKSLEQHQFEDPVLFSIREEVESDPSKFQETYMVRDQLEELLMWERYRTSIPPKRWFLNL